MPVTSGPARSAFDEPLTPPPDDEDATSSDSFECGSEQAKLSATLVDDEGAKLPKRLKSNGSQASISLCVLSLQIVHKQYVFCVAVLFSFCSRCAHCQLHFL